MTTAKVQDRAVVAVGATQKSLPALRPVALPPVLVDTRRVDGWRNPQWVTRALQPGEDVAVQQTLLEVDQRLARAPEGVTLFHVQRLLSNWKNDRNAEEKEWQFDDWAEDLEEFSEIHLKVACRHYRQNNVFPPKIAEIRALCLQEKAKDEITHRRCRVLLGLEDAKPWEQLPARQAESVVMLSDQRRALLEQAVGPLDQLDKRRV